MPSKAKGGAKAKESESKAKELPEQLPPPKTVNERTLQRFYLTNPTAQRREQVGLQGLTSAERQTWINAKLLRPVAQKEVLLSNKAEREFWRQVSKENLPYRSLRRNHDWGKDRLGRDIGEYTPDEFEIRSDKEASLRILEVQSTRFKQIRTFAERGAVDAEGKVYKVAEDILEEERKRRREMAALRKDLYGERIDPYAQDPEWDDVEPIPQNEPDGALTAIAYPDDYAEAVAYLRAVMAADEASPRCLRLTEHVISMNPAHYTVWLYRFRVIASLAIPIPDEIEWLNSVALEHLKNYQIWHHRQLLMDYYYPQIKDKPDVLKALGRSETQFLAEMLDEDTKNYHVWSYRAYLVRKLGLWTATELAATQSLIEDDVRNNSAWSHRFFLVFSDPAYASPDTNATAPDAGIPASIIDREIGYAQEKIALAPQNQSAWNYLRGVLAKAGRKLSTVEEFTAGFVSDLGGTKEEVRSTHALDLLAEVYAEKGQEQQADLALRRLGEKWDPIRVGYWNYRRQMVGGKAAA